MNNFIRKPKENLYETYKDIFDLGRGFGYWLWKPWMIYLTMSNVLGEGDILIYLDAGMKAINDPTPLEDLVREQKDGKIRDIAFFKVPGQDREHSIAKWTKMDTIMAISGQEKRGDYENLRHLPEVLGGFQVYRKTQQSMKFVQMWLNYCCNPQLLTDTPSVAQNFPEFKEHRHDQSILTLLAHRSKDIEIFRDPSQWGNNEIDKFHNSSYGQLFDLHRNQI